MGGPDVAAIRAEFEKHNQGRLFFFPFWTSSLVRPDCVHAGSGHVFKDFDSWSTEEQALFLKDVEVSRVCVGFAMGDSHAATGGPGERAGVAV